MEPIKYTTSLLTFYIKGEIKQEQNFVNLSKPNTVLKLIPLGSKRESIPVSQLSSVESNFKLHFKDFLKGLALSLISFPLIVAFFPLGLILLAIGANMLITAFETKLFIKTTVGDVKTISFLIFEKSKAEEAERQIRQIISDRLNDTNNRIQTNRIVDAINRK